MFEKLNNIRKYGDISFALDDRSGFYCFQSSTDAEKWGEDHYACWAKRYKAIMRIAKAVNRCETSYPFSTIERYCGYDYREINSYLRGNFQGDTLEIYKEMSHILTILLCDAPMVPNNIVVYRLVSEKFVDRLFQNNKNGLPTIEQGLMSTGMLESIADGDEAYAQHKNMLKIYVPKGTPGIYVNTVARRNEHELLIAPNRYLAMISYPYKSDCGKIVTECMLLNMDSTL